MVFSKIKNIPSKIKSIFVKEKVTNYYTPYRTTEYGSGNKWNNSTSRSASINIHNHFAIRQQARDAMYDSIEGRAILESRTDMIVDDGLKLKPTPIAEIIGIEPEKAELWAENVAQRFHLWASSKKSHRSRISNLYQNQRLMQFFSDRDGDYFIRFYYGRDKDLVNPLQIEFIDPNQIRGFGFTSTYAQYKCSDGIVKDEYGREKAYKIWYTDKEGNYKEETIPAKGEKSGRVFMIHGFQQEYAGQSRGMSKITHLIQELENLTDLKFSVLKKAINQASFIAAIENEEQDASQPLEGRVAGPIREYGTSPQVPSSTENNLNSDTTAPVNWSYSPEATLDKPGFLVGNLKRGDKWKNLSDTGPSPQFDTFYNSIVTSLCSSLGWASEVVLKKFGNNYSASRAILILIYRKIQQAIKEIKSDALDAIYEMWLSEEIAAGRIQAPGWSDPLIKEAWLCSEYSGSPMPNIDPAKMFVADKGYVELGAQTLDDVARNWNGSSGKANRIKNARQFKELPVSPFGGAGMIEKEDEETEKDEE